MKFAKMQGTGNDFILVEAQGEERDWPGLARALCDRHFGIGADGLILVLPSRLAEVRMRIFNPDGSEAEMCGNGIRCLTRYAVERGLAEPNEGGIAIETVPGILMAQLFTEDGRTHNVRVSMGQPRFAPAEIPIQAKVITEGPVLDLPLAIEGEHLELTCLSMGNPHAVHFTSEPVENFPLETIGPKIETHPLFPKRVNFEVVRVLARDSMEVRVWERGVGATLACGSGACAAMVAARLHGLVDDRVDIKLPGGTLTVEWDGSNEAYLTGPAELVFEGEWFGEKSFNKN